MLLVATVALGGASPSPAHTPRDDARLNRIGPAPAFALTTQDGTRLALEDLRGKVVALTFIYTTCADTCPLLTAKLVGLQGPLGADLGRKVVFVGITVDPERDTPEALRRYAEGHRASPAGWAFLTGTPEAIADVARRYGVFAKKGPGGDVDHTFLTSVIDQQGILRVQYLGVRFDPAELLRDIRSVLREGATR